MMINQTEKEYRSTMLRIGFAMLMFIALFTLLNSILALVNLRISAAMDSKSAGIVYSLLYDAVYLFSFLFPAGFFYMISRKKRTERVMTEVRLDKSYPLMAVAGLSVVLAAAYLNSYIMEIFNYSAFTDQFMQSEDLSENYLLLLSFITTAIVPAFCEEYLFRGVVLSNLLPYGRTTAVVASAALFALMHQNGGQLLYTFIAGIVLGLIYVRTRSIWGGILLHMFNNLLSVIESLMFDRLDYEKATVICTWLEGIIFVLGIISLIILLVRNKKKEKDFSGSGFGKVFEPDEKYTEKPLARGRAAKLFFSPSVIVFICISGIEMLIYIVWAMSM